MMLDPSQLGGAPAGGPPPTLQIPASGGPQGGSDQDADEPAEKAVKAAIQRWMQTADDPQEHAFAAELYQKVTKFIAQEHDQMHNAMGMSGTLKKIARMQGR